MSGPKSREPWWKHQQWSVITFADGRWQEIYDARKRLDAEEDAAKWRSEMQLPTEVVPGPGHRRFRERSFAERGFQWTPELGRQSR